VRPSRPRNAQSTRDAILTAARTLFTQHGFEGVGVREIAAQVGVNASLVNRYFGSKEALFTAAVDAPFDLSTGAEADPRALATGLVRYILGKPQAEVTGVDPLLMLPPAGGGRRS
jgi:AcrR family transcriptional regulator